MRTAAGWPRHRGLWPVAQHKAAPDTNHERGGWLGHPARPHMTLSLLPRQHLCFSLLRFGLLLVMLKALLDCFTSCTEVDT